MASLWKTSFVISREGAPSALSAPIQVDNYLSTLLLLRASNRKFPDIKNIIYRNIYTQNSNQMMMIKSRGGSGTLQNAQFINFMGHSNAYTLNLDSNWSSQKVADGNGVQYKNLTFSNWHGTCSDGTRRAPIQVLCPAQVPCSGINIQNVNIWTESGKSEVYKCSNAYGSGGCLKGGSNYATYTTTVTVQSMAAA